MKAMETLSNKREIKSVHQKITHFLLAILFEKMFTIATTEHCHNMKLSTTAVWKACYFVNKTIVLYFRNCVMLGLFFFEIWCFAKCSKNCLVSLIKVDNQLRISKVRFFLWKKTWNVASKINPHLQYCIYA